MSKKRGLYIDGEKIADIDQSVMKEGYPLEAITEKTIDLEGYFTPKIGDQLVQCVDDTGDIYVFETNEGIRIEMAKPKDKVVTIEVGAYYEVRITTVE